uniref:Leucine Rich repeats (2 copies) n=1 Tax=Promethearchaeum syntrophicum TaxID=2594042 RepID=A0A5B9DG04_9ARCH|nr:hypothetical protein [Candidatus Prometheoarchaeum syntrophicum]QEE17710.1 hypothetical protein DSAG12_03548 [Candidatus Prometheoarchaeum syntrophicum]
MINEYKEYILRTYRNPKIRDILIEFYDTMFYLDKKLRPEIFQEKRWQPLLNLEVWQTDSKFNNGIEECSIKLGGFYPNNADDRKIVESACIKAFKLIPNIYMIDTNIDITPFLDLTPHLRLLNLHGCPLIEPSPKIGTLKELENLYFIGCDNLITLPDSIEGMQNLISITIELCPKFSVLPESLSNLPMLRKITIRACALFTSLPEDIGKIPKLTSILIESCDNFKDLPRSLSQIPWLTINIKFSNYFLSQSDFPSELWNSCRILWTSAEEIWNTNIEIQRSDDYPDYNDFTNTIFDREITWKKIKSWLALIPSHAFGKLISNAILLSAYNKSIDAEFPIKKPCKFTNEIINSIYDSFDRIKKPTLKDRDIGENLFSLFYYIRNSIERNDYNKEYLKNEKKIKKIFSKVQIELIYHLESWIEKCSNRLDLRNYLSEYLFLIRPTYKIINNDQEFKIFL